MKLWIPVFAGMVLSMLSGCATAPTPTAPFVTPPPVAVSRHAALVRLDLKDMPAWSDDLDASSLRTGALQSLAYYQSLPEEQLFVLGNDTYTARDMVASMASLVTILEGSPDKRDWLTVLNETFVAYQSVGTDAEKTVVFSSYYEPTIAARLTRDKKFKYPFYARPPDLLDVDISLFDPAYQGVRIAGRREGRAVVPYPTRADIDSRKILSQKNLELAWGKDPLDVLDLQIEGSGWLDLGKGNVKRIRYDGDNGRRYRSVGQYLITTGRIPAKKFSREAFWRYMGQHPKERQELLNINERYIFFRIDTSTAAPYAFGNISVPLTPLRSIATDPKLFPKGALAWISIDGGLSRFMLNQDEGGAIQGPGRVDIFAGHGQNAKAFATRLWNKGKLYFLVKKKS